jgi:hypothetical protein
MKHIKTFESFLGEAVDPKLKDFDKNYAAINMEKDVDKTFNLYVVPLSAMKFIEKDHNLKKRDRVFYNQRAYEDLTKDLEEYFIGTYNYPSHNVYEPAGIEVYYDINKD